MQSHGWSELPKSKSFRYLILLQANILIIRRISTGVTFKQAKGDLLKKSWTEGESGDRDALYWLNGNRFERLTEDAWAVIVQGEAKL